MFKGKKRNSARPGDLSEHDDGRGTAITLTLAVILLYIILAVILQFFGTSKKYIEAEKLDDLLTVDIIHEDQTTTSYSGNIFSPPLETDNVYVHVPLPKSRRVSSAMLCFSYYNANIQVFASDNKLIYSSNSAERLATNLTGHMMIKASIPNYCWGNFVNIRIDSLEDKTISTINGVYVVNSSQSAWYPVLLNGQFTLVLVLFFFLTSLLLLSLLIVLQLKGNKVGDGIMLMLFSIGGSIWALCYTGLMYMCSGNSRLCAFGEYYVSYLIMPVLTGYFCLQHVKPRTKLFLRIFTAVLAAFAAAVYTGEIIKSPFNVISSVPVFRILLIIVLISCAAVLINMKNKRDASGRVQVIGFIIIFILVILEIIRNAAVSSAGEGIYKAHFIAEINLIMPICIVFVSTLMISYMSRFMRARQLEQENATLQNLAKYDALTGIPNRLYITQAIHEIEKNNINEYAIFFMDANNLKKANDEYGHECGDKLLKLVGRALKEASDGQAGFYGRYGGDEFVACLYDISAADRVEKRFYEIISEANDEASLPFPVSVAIGKVIHKASDISTPEEALKMADNLMYKNKIAMKGSAR